MKHVYLDHMAATPLHPEVRQAMKSCIDRPWGNPMSLHHYGEEPRFAIEESRRKVAELIHADPREITFVSCGTEANNTAVRGLAASYRKKGRHIITSRIEHPSVLQSCQALEREGFRVTYLPVDRDGKVNPLDVERAISAQTILISVMWANHEIGTLQPLRDIARIAHEHGAVFHADAVAAAGRVPVHVDALEIDALSLAANQFYGPPGVAALYVRRGARITPLLEGGVQESGRRAGTENITAIVGMGKAAEIAQGELDRWGAHLRNLEMRLVRGLKQRLDRMILTGHPEDRLCGHVSLCLEFVEGEAQLRALSQKGIAAATGSACRDYSTRKVSHILEAIGLDIRLAQGSLVFTMGRENTEEEIDYVLDVLPPLVEQLRSISPIYSRGVKPSSG